jgi:hypothetical protein
MCFFALVIEEGEDASVGMNFAPVGKTGKEGGRERRRRRIGRGWHNFDG